MLGGPREVLDFKFSAHTLASWYARGWRWSAVSTPSWICSAGRQQALLKLPFFVLISGLLPAVKSFPSLCHLEEEHRVNVIVSPADPKSSHHYTGSIQQHLVIITFFPVLSRHCFSCSSEWEITSKCSGGIFSWVLESGERFHRTFKIKEYNSLSRQLWIFFSAEFCFPLLSLFTERWAKSSSNFPAVVFLLCTALPARVLICVTMLVIQSKAERYFNTMCEYLSL